MSSTPACRGLLTLFGALAVLALAGCQKGDDSGAALAAAGLTQGESCLDGDPACTPTGAHLKHGGFACSVCHKVAGRLGFDKNGPAYAAGQPTPIFDATAKTCTNVACHGTPAGIFEYYTMDGMGEALLTSVAYGGTSRATPSWYITGGAGCTACHDDPPKDGSTWHSGYHGGQGPTGKRNQCQFCHPDVSSPGNGIGDTITNALLHANGMVDMQAAFTSVCFGCH